MKKLVRFSVVRFMPFTETQEFANVGIVLHVPKDGTVLYSWRANVLDEYLNSLMT